MKSVLIIDRICFFSLIPAVTKFRANRSVFYLHKGRGIFVNVAMNVLSKFGWSFEPILYTLAPIGEFSPFKELQKLVIDIKKTCREKIFSEQVNKLIGISEYERVRLSTCFAKHAGRELYHVMQLFVLLVIKCPFRDKIRTILLRKTIFADIITGTYENGNFKPYFYSAFGSGKFIPRKTFKWDKRILNLRSLVTRRFIRIMTLLCYSILCKLLCIFLNPKKLIKKHKICALVAGSNATEIGNNITWSIKRPDYLENETLALHLPAMPKNARDFYRKKADKFVEYSFSPFRGNKSIELIISWAYFFDFFFKNIRLYRKLFGFRSVKRWMSKYLLDVITYLSFFEALFCVNGTKLLWTADLDDSQTQMAGMAINRLGGISLGTTLSHGIFPGWDLWLNKNDVYFAWGKRFAHIRLNNHDECGYYIVIGYPMDRIFVNEFKKGRDFRSSILKRYNVKNILTLYDIGSGDEQMVSRKQFFDMYKELFSWLEKGHGNFLVIKAKRPGTINKYRTIKEKIDAFCENRRILIVREKSALYPGLAADAVISPSPTPASLIAVLGHPLVFYNTLNIGKKYSLDFPNVRVVTSADELEEAIDSTIGKSRNRKYPERLQPLKNSPIDPFMDGKARERMRAYIGNLLRKLDDGCSNAEALRFANEEHRTRWGKDTVISGPLPVR